MGRLAEAWTHVRQRWPWMASVPVPLLLEAHTVGDAVRIGLSWWGWLLAQGLLLPLLLRRRYPLAVFAIVAGMVLVQDLTEAHLTAGFALLVAVYNVAAHARRRFRIQAGLLLETVLIVASLRLAPAGDSFLISLVFLNSLVAAAVFLGTTVRTRRQYLESLEERAERAERERDQQAWLAATAERTRIAREMHDVIAHSLSVVIRLADGAVTVNRTDPDSATSAMEQVAVTGRQALAEMRRLLGVLRDAPTAGVSSVVEMAPSPGLAHLDTLLDDVRATGLWVELTMTGSPRALPGTAEAAIYRVVQESLTNVLKHAVSPTRVDVELRWRADRVLIRVRDDGTVVGLPGGASGHGLRGMLERVALYEGDVTYGPTSPRGWEVNATIRVNGAVA